MIDRATERHKSVPTLVRELVGDARLLLRDELQLARTETAEKVAQLGRDLVPIAVAGVLGLGGFVMLLVALQHGLGLVLARATSPETAIWLSPLILAIALGIAAWSLFGKGKTAIQRLSLNPEKTKATLQENKQWIRERLS